MMNYILIVFLFFAAGWFLRKFTVERIAAKKNLISYEPKHFKPRKKFTHATMEKHKNFDYKITYHYDDGSKEEFIGDCTVWKSYPMMTMCGTFKEVELHEVWSYVKEHGNPFPTAHETKKLRETSEKYGLS